MSFEASLLRDLADRLRYRRERATAAFVAHLLRSWAASVESGDRDAIVVAIKTAATPDRNGYGFELESYAEAARILRRALDATRAA